LALRTGRSVFLSARGLVFSLKVNATAREALGELAKKQINFEAETLATVIAFRFWLPRFAMYLVCR
jgi:hypothetical protein